MSRQADLRPGPAAGSDAAAGWASPQQVEASPAGTWAGPERAEAFFAAEQHHDRVLAAALPISGCGRWGEALGYWQSGWNSKGAVEEARQRAMGFLIGGPDGIRVVGETGSFTIFFLVFCCATFAVPILIIFSVARDIQVRYWISDDAWWMVLSLPVLYIASAVVHSQQGGRPNRIAMALCTLGSCLLLLGLADYLLLEAQGTAGDLAAWSCDTSPSKRELQLQWTAAQAFYSGCMMHTAVSTGSNLAETVGIYRIQECTGYKEQLAVYPAWPYLQSLEEDYRCGGWCRRGQALWTIQPVEDACSAAVADVLYNKISWSMSQVIVYTLLALGLISMTIVAGGPALRAAGH